MESLAVAEGLWKQAQDQAFACQQKAETMRRRVGNVSDARRTFIHARQKGDQLVLSRDEAVLRCHLAELQLALREMEAFSSKFTALLAEAMGQSKMFGVLDICPDGA